MEDNLSDWIGKSQSVVDLFDPGRSNALNAALEKKPLLLIGEPLPALYHWLYFWTVTPPSGLGADGHPAKGGFLPPISLPRRMWAGGRLRFVEPLILGTTVTRTSTILNITAKSGKNGDLVFVTVEHRLSCDGRDAIIEEQDIVYREAATENPALPKSSAPSSDVSPDAPFCEFIMPNSILLFRYSALTMNSHRIHYDQHYAQQQEAYPALVVQGPLQATLLADFATRKLGKPLSHFEYRGQSPAFEGLPLYVCGEEQDGAAAFWTEQGGARSMIAQAS